MADFTISPNMMLLIPIVDQDPGPDWANNLNASLTLVDAHNHSPGYGVQITPAGLNINADLAINDNNLTLVKSVRFLPQPSPLAGGADIGCLYESGVDLYYNDGAGNQVRITAGGSVTGAAGNITGLVSPASVVYSSITQTFTFESAAATPANLDAASIVLRNLVANSKGLTLTPPAAMAADYTITLPELPLSERFVSIDQTGQMFSHWHTDNSTVEISNVQLQVKNLGITAGKLATGSVTRAKLSPTGVGQQLSGTCALFSTSNSTPIVVSPLTVTITTLGRPVMVMMIPAAGVTHGVASSTTISIAPPDAASVWIDRDGTIIATSLINPVDYTPVPLMTLDPVGAGTYTYTIYTVIEVGSGPVVFVNWQLVAYEL